MPTGPLPSWLRDWSEGRAPDPSEALARALSLPSPGPEEMTGLWRGRSLPTGHALDGLLERLGWFGKAVEAPDRVHPLLFRRPAGGLVALEPAWMPTGIALRWPALAGSAPCRLGLSAMAPLLRARGPGARLETRAFGGRSGLALVYRRQPIADHLCRAGPDAVIGLMEHPRMPQPFAFLLTREGTAARPAHSAGTMRQDG